MEANDYDIKIDPPQFLDKESVQRLADKAIDINNIRSYVTKERFAAVL